MLLQEIRFIHALAEKEEVTVTQRELPVMEHLSKYFDVKYKLGGVASFSVAVNHETPSVTYKGKTRPLVFPRGLIRAEQKDIDYFFQGTIQGREGDWDNFPNATIIESGAGRDFPTKAYDPDYFDKMARTKFALVPNGVSFPWSYRFFEAVLSGAVPLVEEPLPLYDGYKFFIIGQPHEFKQDYIQHNLDKIIKDCML